MIEAWARKVSKLLTISFVMNLPPCWKRKEDEERVWRVILLGRGSVGKSELVKRLADPEAEFDPNYECSRGYRVTRIRFMAAQGVLEGGEEEVLMDVVDTSGQESPVAEVPELAPKPCFQGADGALVMFDLSRRETLQKDMMYMPDVRALAGDGTRYVFVGNKNDLTACIRGREIATLVNGSRSAGYNVVGRCLKMSLKNGGMANFIEPSTMLAREFLGNESLELVSCQLEPTNDASRTKLTGNIADLGGVRRSLMSTI